jgi:hypothetical protein
VREALKRKDCSANHVSSEAQEYEMKYRSSIAMKCRRPLFAVVAVVAILAIASPSWAECPGPIQSGSARQVSQFSYGPGMGTGNPFFDFIGPVACATVKFGTMQPTFCQALAQNLTTIFSAGANVRWGSASAATANNTANGCTFICQGGSCRMRGGDTLPVELMDFSVDDDAANSEIVPESEPEGGPSFEGSDELS